MKSDLHIALTQLAAERHLPKETVLQVIEAALASAFKKEAATAGLNVSVRLNPNTGEIRVFALRTVVEQVEDPRKEISLDEARRSKRDAEMGDVLSFEAPIQQASRIAAQTARQVVLQRLREAEREQVYQEFAQRTGEIISGMVSGVEPGNRVTVDLGRNVQGVLPPEEQVPTERYKKNERVRAYVVEVRRSPKGPEILLSRTHRNLLKRLLELEVPEVQNGVVEIKAIAREPGSRSKVAVATRQEGVDPVGSCIGPRGVRIQNVTKELSGEKVDVVRWDKDLAPFIGNALSPAEVVHVELNHDDHAATIMVPDRQLSLAIGKEGQNARLAAKLTGWRLDIKGATEWQQILAQREAEAAVAAAAAREAAQAAVAEAPAIAEAVTAEPVPAQPVEAPVAETPEPVPADQALAAPVAQAPAEATAPVQEEMKQPAAPSEDEELRKLEAELKALEAQEQAAKATAQVAPTAPVEEQTPEEEEEEEEGIPEDFFKVPAIVPQTGVIRFREDILGERPGKGGKDRRREREDSRGRSKSKSRTPGRSNSNR